MALNPVFDEYKAYLASPKWSKLKEKLIYKNKNVKCFVCGTKHHLLLHHIGYKNIKSDKLFKHVFLICWGDIMVVCKNCHDNIHFGLFGHKTSLRRNTLIKRAFWLRVKSDIMMFKPLDSVYYLICYIFTY